MPRIRDLGINVVPGGMWAQGCQGSGGGGCQASCGDSCKETGLPFPSCDTSGKPSGKKQQTQGLHPAAIAQLRQQLQSYARNAF
jgi:hypothetical protein